MGNVTKYIGNQNLKIIGVSGGLITMLSVLAGLGWAGDGKNLEYYFCHRPVTQLGELTLGRYDEILIVEGEQGSRLIKEHFGRDATFKVSHDEGDKITTVYKYRVLGKRDWGHHDILQLNLSSNPAHYVKVLGVHTTYEQFQKNHPGQTVLQWNLNPEFIKYLPPRPPEKDISYAFAGMFMMKRKIPCKKLSYMGYLLRIIQMNILGFLSA